MKKNLLILVLCAVLMVGPLSGCAGRMKLSEEQQARIDLFVQNRDEWTETTYYGTHYPVTRLHIYETEDGGLTLLTVAYVDDDSALGDGWQTFVGVCGYAVKDGEFVSVGDYHHKDWLATCIPVDMETMSDEELREALTESYIKFLSKD